MQNHKGHAGFDKTAAKIARKEHIPKPRARAILAASTRKASQAAKRRNAHLRRVR